MPTPVQVATEAAIDRILLERWDPLGINNTPGPHNEYARHAHEVFSLIARGGSDVQIARFLHRAERDDFNHPELADRDLSALVRDIRALEANLGPSVR